MIFVKHVLVSLHVIRLVTVEVIHLNLASRRGVCASCDYDKMDAVEFPTMHLSPLFKGKESPCHPTVMYSEVKHSLSNYVKRNDGAELLTGSFVFEVCFGFVCSSVMHIHDKSTCCQYAMFRVTLRTLNWASGSLTESYHCYRWNEEGLGK